MDATARRDSGLLARRARARRLVSRRRRARRDDPRPLGRALGERRAPAARRLARGAASRCLALVDPARPVPAQHVPRRRPRPLPATPARSPSPRRAILRGRDRRVALPERQFFYMPLMHSEILADQDQSVRLFLIELRPAASILQHARAHREIIRRFGRFPFRNAALGRESTPEEVAFLDEGGYRAIFEEIAALTAGAWRRRGNGGDGRWGRGRDADGSHDLRRRRDRRRPRRLCRGDPRGAARAQDRDRRARAPGRHLPQLGLHPDQGAAALGRDLPPDAPRQGVRPEGREHRLRPRRRGRSARAAWPSSCPAASAPDEEEQDRRASWATASSPARARSRSRPTRAPRTIDGQARSSSPPARGRATCRGSRPTASGSGPTPRADAAADAEEAAGDRLGRDRHRVRQLLQRRSAPR